jgi:quinol monooxygenase YgiN
MPMFEIARFEVQRDKQLDAERAMHEFATYVRTQLPDCAWTAYREAGSPTRYLTYVIAKSPAAAAQQHDASGTKTFRAAITPLLAGAIEESTYELVTSSDLGRRHKPR